MDIENTGAIPAVSSDTSPLPPIEDGLMGGLGKTEAALLVRSGSQKNQRFILSGKKITLGRADDCTIVLDDVTVSRLHAEITKDNKWMIKDMKSLNGLYVNHERVESINLEAGDDIQIGKYRFSFLLSGQNH